MERYRRAFTVITKETSLAECSNPPCGPSHICSTHALISPLGGIDIHGGPWCKQELPKDPVILYQPEVDILEVWLTRELHIAKWVGNGVMLHLDAKTRDRIVGLEIDRVTKRTCGQEKHD